MAEQIAPPWPNGSVDFDAACALARKGQLDADTVKNCVSDAPTPEPEPEAPAPDAPTPAAAKKEA